MLPRSAKEFLKLNSSSVAHQVVTQFHAWLEREGIFLSKLTHDHLAHFLRKPAATHLDVSSQKQYRVVIERYLAQLYVNGVCGLELCSLASMRKRSIALPPYAEEFLNLNPQDDKKRLVTYFHRWLYKHSLELQSVQPSHIRQFIKQPRNKVLSPTTQRVYKQILLRYLDFLHQKALLVFDPAVFGPTPLPDYAERFLSELAITLKPGTLRNYKGTLGAFHSFLIKQDIPLEKLERETLLAWFTKQKELHPSTRRSHIVNLRVYARWLHEQNLIHQHPDSLIRSKDFPRLPDYLPRALLPTVDQKLQQRLTRSKNRYAKALLLMRKSGIRIGELLALEFNCVRSDSFGNHSLKVPLGKLNSERLVPLDESALALISDLQQRKPTPRTYLVSEMSTLKTPRENLTSLLDNISVKLKLDRHITSHQLRHTCATELLNAGLPLPALMRFLGHSDYRMTFRYARITQNTLVHEFNNTRDFIQKRYLYLQQQTPEDDPILLITHLMKWLNSTSSSSGDVRHLQKRLLLIKSQVVKIQRLTHSTT